MLLPGDTFTESYPAVPEAVGEARNALTAFAREAGANHEQLEAVRLVTSEAVTNAVLHAYRNREEGTVHVSASYVADELWLLVSDTGGGMQTENDSPGLGLGLVLIAQLADDLQILSRGSGTELRLRFNLAQTKRREDRRMLAPGTSETRGGSASRQSAGSGPDRGSVSTAVSPA